MISFRKLFSPAAELLPPAARTRAATAGAACDALIPHFARNCALARGNDAGSARPGHAKPAWEKTPTAWPRSSPRSIACAACSASSASRCRRSSRPQVFARSIGETTDVVSKEMYTFEDRGGEFDHAAARVHRRHLPRLSVRGLAAARAAEGRDPRLGVPLRAAAEGPLPRVPPARRRDHRRRRAAGRRRDAEPRPPAAARARHRRRRDARAQHARRSGDARCLARGAGRVFPGAPAPTCPRTASRGSSAIRCASSTARTRSDRADLRRRARASTII